MEAKTMVNELILNARKAQEELNNCTQEQVDAYVKAIGKVVYDHAEE